MLAIGHVAPSVVKRRRLLFIYFNMAMLLAGIVPLAGWLAAQGWTVLRVVMLVISLILLTQVVYGFTLAVTGWWLLRRGGDQLRIHGSVQPDSIPPKLPATAIVMPIYNEDVNRVFQGLKVMFESLRETGRGDAFDFFILSDSDDINVWVAEEMAWIELCRQVKGFGRIFYRKRRLQLHHKSGNIADFCRRWGNAYRYMIVLDADSVMTGAAFVRLVTLMEQRPQVGIIQTLPRTVLGETLFQRIMQFGAHLCGPMFTAGANFWQLDSGNFWGHNAIVRLRPFIEQCAVPELPSNSLLGTRVMSHDTVEAALMLRAGYAVWMDYTLEGSYEENPPDLPATMRRDQRWCFGNLQHLWLVFARGFKSASRFHILNGIMAYVSAPLWLLLLVVGTAAGILDGKPPVGHSLIGPVGGFVFAGVMLLLFVPKILGLTLLRRNGEKVGASTLAEALFSMLSAPILMLFHSQFVWGAFTGTKTVWKNQQRNSSGGLALREAVRTHWRHTVLIAIWAGIVGWLQPRLLVWLAPVFLGPLLAIPLAHFTGSKVMGELARKKGWFVIPEEIRPPKELRDVQKEFALPTTLPSLPQRKSRDFGLLLAFLDPIVNAVHVSLLRHRTKVTHATRQYISVLVERLLREGPEALSAREKRAVLWDAEALLRAHRQLWSTPESTLHEWWQVALRHYSNSGDTKEIDEMPAQAAPAHSAPIVPAAVPIFPNPVASTSLRPEVPRTAQNWLTKP